MSEYTRRKNADENGYVKCVTCGIVKHWKEMQDGHFIPFASCSELRYVPENNHPQCYGCNVGKNGNYTPYTLYMEDIYGRKMVDDMVSIGKAHKAVKMTVTDYEEIESMYQTLISLL